MKLTSCLVACVHTHTYAYKRAYIYICMPRNRKENRMFVCIQSLCEYRRTHLPILTWLLPQAAGSRGPDPGSASWMRLLLLFFSVAPRMKSDSSVALGGPPASNFTSGSSHKLSAAGMSSFLLRPHTRGPAPSGPSSWSSSPHLVMLPSPSPHQHPGLSPERLS